MDRERLDRWCERGLLGLVLSILIFGPLAFGAVRTLEFVAIQCLTMTIILLWIFRLWVAPRPVFFWPPICWVVLAFVIYAIVRYRLAPIEYVARFELIKVIVYAFLFLAILNNLNRQESIQVIGLALIALAFAQSVLAIYQFITHSEKIWTVIKPEGYLYRGSGTYINPNNFAGFVELILPLGLTYTLIGRFNHSVKVMLAYASLTIMIGIGVSLSRGGWISSALMLMVLFFVLIFQKDFRLRSIIVLVLLLAFGIGAVATAQVSKQRFKQIIPTGKLENDDRFRYWDSSIQIWKENVWLGAGPGHYDSRFRQYRSPDLQGRPQYVHNDYLNTLADWGGVGLGLIAAFLVIFGVSVLKTWRFVQRSANDLGTKKSNKAAFVLGGSLGVLALAFHSVVDFNMHIPANAITALTLVALVTTYLRFATENFWASVGVPFKIFLTLAGFSGTFYLGQQAVLQTREELCLQRAIKETDGSPGKLAMLEKAFSIEPKNFEVAYSIGEIFRARSWVGLAGYEKWAQDAMLWFQRSMDLDPYNPYPQLRYGMCLDWLGKTEQGASYFQRAYQLDPNGYFTAAHLGWHSLQVGDYVTAKKEFTRSNHLRVTTMAETYLEIIEQKMSEPAAP